MMAMMRSTTGEMHDFTPMFRACEQWYGQAMHGLYASAPPPGNGLLMGCPLWGDEYVKRFEKFWLPSLLAAKNLGALRHAVRIVLFTDAASYPTFVERFKHLDAYLGHGAIQIKLIPDAVIAELPTHWMQKFWVMGTAHNICIREAARCGMNFHMTAPDIAYNPEYFPNLLRLSSAYDGVLQDCFTAATTVEPELEAYRRGATLEVPELDLCDLAWRHLHPQQKVLLMNDRNLQDSLPSKLWLGWQGHDRVYTAFPHLNPSWMSWKLCMQAPSRIPATIDAEVPSFVSADSNYLVAKANHGLGYIEISGDNKPSYPENRDRRGFAKEAWSIMKFSDRYLPYYQHLSEIPIRPQNTYMDEGLIRRMHKNLMCLLVEGKGQAAVDFGRSLDLSRSEAEEAAMAARTAQFAEWCGAEKVYA